MFLEDLIKTKIDTITPAKNVYFNSPRYTPVGFHDSPEQTQPDRSGYKNIPCSHGSGDVPDESNVCYESMLVLELTEKNYDLNYANIQKLEDVPGSNREGIVMPADDEYQEFKSLETGVDHDY